MSTQCPNTTAATMPARICVCIVLFVLNGAHAVDLEALLSSAHACGPWLQKVRRELHQIPELSFQRDMS